MGWNSVWSKLFWGKAKDLVGLWLEVLAVISSFCRKVLVVGNSFEKLVC